MRIQSYSCEEFAKLIYDILKSDRDVNLGMAGMTGEGKSTCLYQIFKHYCKIAGIKWDWDFLTWDRKELLNWIDGDEDGVGQKTEYSPIMCDELISMFYKRNWYDENQKSSVELLNKCRDRHLFIAGAVPNFWDLDGGILTRFRFYLYVKERGEAWIFKQDNNPFASDTWNLASNKKVFVKNKNPYKCPNFLGILRFDDFDADEKLLYYDIRNKKRIGTEGQNTNKTNKQEGSRSLKRLTISRNRLVRFLNLNTDMKMTELAELCGFSEGVCYDICSDSKGYKFEFQEPRYDIKNYRKEGGEGSAPPAGSGTK